MEKFIDDSNDLQQKAAELGKTVSIIHLIDLNNNGVQKTVKKVPLFLHCVCKPDVFKKFLPN